MNTQVTMQVQNNLPKTGFLRIKQIVGDPKASPPIPAIIPVSKSKWWMGVKTHEFPQPIKLSCRVTVWRVEDILTYIENQKKT